MSATMMLTLCSWRSLKPHSNYHLLWKRTKKTPNPTSCWVINKSEIKFKAYGRKLITGTDPRCKLSAWLNCKFLLPCNSYTFGQCTMRATPSHIQHQEQCDHPSTVTFHNTFVAWHPQHPLKYLICHWNSNNCSNRSCKWIMNC